MQLSFEYDRHYFPAFPILEFTVAVGQNRANNKAYPV
jgi:hypothetical protein